MPLQQTSGNDTQDAYGGGKAVVPVYVENVFSTYVYTGTGANQTITNGIDLSTKGGFVWIKIRDVTGNNNSFDTAQGAGKYLVTNTNAATVTDATTLTSFNTNGFSLGADRFAGYVNGNGNKFVSWTFRKQPKFFDVVTYTGTGSVKNIAHNLGSIPGCIIVKQTDTAGNWSVYHSGTNNGTNPQNYVTYLNLTDAQSAQSVFWNNTAPTSTQFTIGTGTDVNTSGGTYVAYLFASNAGGFGLTGTDNVITCGSFTTNGSGNATVTLGYEPQFVITKATSSTSDWVIEDNMRGFTSTPVNFSNNPLLAANTSSAENTGGGTTLSITSTGFKSDPNSYPTSTSFIYIAIRRGPMAVPTDPTKVFAPVLQGPSSGTGSATNPNFLSNFPVDLFTRSTRTGAAGPVVATFADRLRGSTNTLATSSTSAEGFANYQVDSQTGAYFSGQSADSTISSWNFRRAPNFFDVVCYTGTGSATTQAHNLGVAPELIIVKCRSTARAWPVYSQSLGNNQTVTLNLTNATQTNAIWNNTSPTNTVFSISPNVAVNNSGDTYVAYLFATCPGVSKVGSYTGNGTTQTINCGFAGGARFVLIKRTDSTGDWYVYDTARGMTTLTDPYLLMNSTAAESATLGSVTSVTTGFAVNASVLAAINTNAASYIFLAIA